MHDLDSGGTGRGLRLRPLLRTTVGKVLRRIRLDQGRTLADVAKAARVSLPYLSELERGRKEASSEVLAAVCDALGIEMSDLLAQVGRELIDARLRQAQVIRLDAIRAQRDGRLPGQARGSGDITCRLAA
jgi:transcriptional regulator with XRE-family HTH domain